MLCDSCQRLDLDQICGLALGDSGSNGYELTSAYKRICFHHDGSKETGLSCDVCQAIFGPVSSQYRLALLTSGDPGVLPVSFMQSIAKRHSKDGDLGDSVRQFTGSKDDPNTTLVKGSTLGRPLDSDACITIASRWLEECISQSGYAHKYCPNIKSTQYPMPSRVINVGPADGSQEPRLQQTDRKAGQWVALSHCWGSAMMLNTTKDTLKLREQKIPFKDLPLSFQDAVTITRKLGYRYLWIDSLCIIQDSVEDWNTESGSMGDTYSNAVFCIAAEAAPDSSLGIFESSKRERFLGLVKGQYVRPSNRTKGLLWLRENSAGTSRSSGYISRDLEPLISMEGPLSQRAWALQENFLAPRIIRYSQKELKWSCRSFKCVEEEPHRRTPCDGSKHIFRTPKPAGQLPISGLDQDKPILLCWYKMVNEFVARKLTFEVDRLPAISGIAKEIRSRIRGTYTYRAGLWQEDIHRGLLWSTKGQALPGSQYSGPSWSWASVTWSDFAPTTTYNVEYTAPFDPNTSNLSPLYSSSDTSIVSVVVEPSSSNKDPYLKVRSVALNLDGLTYSFDSLLGVSRPGFHQPSFQGFKRSETAIGSVTYCELDLYKPDLWTVSDLKKRGIIYLQITKTKWRRKSRLGWEGEILWALILEPTSKTANQYRRIGIAEICPADSMAKGWTKREIQIV
ncbi:HET-domain-containing protein [Hyaloscypha variabilis F]|uniref:HET-domain-containing protein n=1 Tax=Hyaloscypha variabilis (strain UAMH 11265 / GT02V1 / F) TaxID=1149755 RepID=A0A2J6QUW6_HYAVF|nr:HET-domain-containing protein [Hyaloscypha variabilis F]